MDTTVQITLYFPVYAMGLMAFIGWFILIFFLPTGMQAVPFEWITSFIQRPKPMLEDEFNRAKATLAK